MTPREDFAALWFGIVLMNLREVQRRLDGVVVEPEDEGWPKWCKAMPNPADRNALLDASRMVRILVNELPLIRDTVTGKMQLGPKAAPQRKGRVQLPIVYRGPAGREPGATPGDSGRV